MQQLSQVCMVDNHEQKPIEYACVYPQCNLNRFLCSKCLKLQRHRHQQFNHDYIVDHREMLQYVRKTTILQDQSISQKEKYKLKQILQEIQSQTKNLLNFIEKLEQGIEQFHTSLLKLNNSGFNQLDDNDLNNLIKIDSQVHDIYQQIAEQSNPIIQNLIRIQEYCHLQMKEDSGLEQKIKDAECQLITQDQLKGEFAIYSSAISNDLKYIASGGSDKMVKIWNYENNTLIKSIQLDNCIYSIKFTDDSKFLYVGLQKYLHQFDLCNQFKETYKQAIHSDSILNILCITNTIILTSSEDNTIIKTDINLKQQLLVIEAHSGSIDGLDYNVNLNLIASAFHDKSIKLWNGNNGELIIEKQDANNGLFINQIFFIIKKNQLIGSITYSIIVIWNINFEKQQLEQIQIINDIGSFWSISLVLDQQYISFICSEHIKIYSIKGDYIRSINHDVEEFCLFYTVQPQSMKAIIVKGEQTLQICKIHLD